MYTSSHKINYLSDSPLKILVSICMPLIGVNILLALTTTVTNQLYSFFIGPDAFAVTGYLNTAITAFSNIVASIMSSAWIIMAPSLTNGNHEEYSYQIHHGIVAIGIVDLVLAFFFLLMTVPVLTLLHVPDAIRPAAITYYILYIFLYLPIPIAGLLLTIVNGTSSSLRLFLVNVVVVVCNFVASFFLLAVFRAGMTGLSLSAFTGALLQLIFNFFLFKKEGIAIFPTHIFQNIQWKLVGRIIRYGLLIALQNLICTFGYLLVTYQTNRFLTLEFISVLNVSLPLTGIMSAAGSACLAFCPQNYRKGNEERLKSFLSLTLTCCFLYGILCFLLYTLLGNWYFVQLFNNELIISYGKTFWLCQGIGHIFLSLIFPIRSFFNSIGMSRLSLLSGIGELLGNFFCAFYLIPNFGNIGRCLSYPLGWCLASALLFVALLYYRKRNFLLM